MERELSLFTDGGGGISDKVLFLWYYSSILIIGNDPRPGAPPGREHRFKSMKAIRSSSTQRLSVEVWKYGRRPFSHLDILCAGDEAYFINN